MLGFFAAPNILGLEGMQGTISYVLAGAHLVLTLATDFPLGLARVIPFPLHGMIEFFDSILLFVMPWLLGFSGDETARSFYIGAGASVLLVFLITDYRKSDRA